MSSIVERLIVTQVFSCTCDVKTPDIQFHSLDCRYRTLAEAASTIITLRAALEILDLGICEKFTSGIGECFRSGLTADAEYLADRACTSCIAHKALEDSK
jgi:hypothetical protein